MVFGGTKANDTKITTDVCKSYPKMRKTSASLARCDNICYNKRHDVLIPYNQISPDEVYRKSRELLPKE